MLTFIILRLQQIIQQYMLNCQLHLRFIPAFHKDLTYFSLVQVKCMAGGAESKSWTYANA